jgi:hypothetical protein
MSAERCAEALARSVIDDLRAAQRTRSPQLTP